MASRGERGKKTFTMEGQRQHFLLFSPEMNYNSHLMSESKLGVVRGVEKRKLLWIEGKKPSLWSGGLVH